MSGYYTILVYAYCYTCSGTANVVIDGSTYAAGITVGGDVIFGVLNGNYTYETALMPGGAACTDTLPLGLRLHDGQGRRTQR